MSLDRFETSSYGETAGSRQMIDRRRCAIADQPDASFAGSVATVSKLLGLVRFCLIIVLIDFNVW